MLNVETTNDVSVLKQVATLQEQEIKRLKSLLHAQQKELAVLKGLTPEQMQLRIATLELQLDQRNKVLFGKSSEQRNKPQSVSDSNKAKQEQRGHGNKEQPQLQLVEQVHNLDKADEQCPKCGGELWVFKDQFEESEEISHVERRFVLVKHKRQKYICGCGCIETAEGPQKLMSGGRYSIEFAAHVATSKYQDHLPLERQVGIMRREGLQTDSQTLWDQIWALSRPLQATYEALQARVLSAPVVFADETTWELLQSGSKQHYAWAVCSKDAVFERIIGSRSHQGAKDILQGYTGVVMVDGYKGYDAAARAGPFTLAHCWAHVRRKFFDQKKNEPHASEQILDLIGELYAIEARLPSIFDLTVGDDAAVREKRLALRNAESRLVLDRIKTWAIDTSPRALPQSGLRKAIDYMLTLWPGLTVFCDNVDVPLDNNHAERALRSLVLGRKNHLGSRSQRGLEATAIFYTLLGSAKLAGIEPNAYLASAARAALANPGTVTLPKA